MVLSRKSIFYLNLKFVLPKLIISSSDLLCLSVDYCMFDILAKNLLNFKKKILFIYCSLLDK